MNSLYKMYLEHEAIEDENAGFPEQVKAFMREEMQKEFELAILKLARFSRDNPDVENIMEYNTSSQRGQ